MRLFPVPTAGALSLNAILPEIAALPIKNSTICCGIRICTVTLEKGLRLRVPERQVKEKKFANHCKFIRKQNPIKPSFHSARPYFTADGFFFAIIWL